MSNPLYALQAILTLLPSAVCAAAIYSTYVQILDFVEERPFVFITTKFITIFLFIGSFTSILVLTVAGVLRAFTEEFEIARYMLLGGCQAQLLFLLCFSILNIPYRWRSRALRYAIAIPDAKYNWTRLLIMLQLAAALLIAPTVFRSWEYAHKDNNSIMYNEFVIYIVGFIPMLIVQVAFHIIHPGMVLPSSSAERELALLDLYASHEDAKNGWKFAFAEKLKEIYNPFITNTKQVQSSTEYFKDIFLPHSSVSSELERPGKSLILMPIPGGYI